MDDHAVAPDEGASGSVTPSESPAGIDDTVQPTSGTALAGGKLAPGGVEGNAAVEEGIER